MKDGHRDGRCIVIGTLDLLILRCILTADSSVAGSYKFLATLPPRTRQVRVLSENSEDGGGSFDRNGGHSDDESVDNKKKKRRVGKGRGRRRGRSGSCVAQNSRRCCSNLGQNIPGRSSKVTSKGHVIS